MSISWRFKRLDSDWAYPGPGCPRVGVDLGLGLAGPYIRTRCARARHRVLAGTRRRAWTGTPTDPRLWKRRVQGRGCRAALRLRLGDSLRGQCHIRVIPYINSCRPRGQALGTAETAVRRHGGTAARRHRLSYESLASIFKVLILIVGRLSLVRRAALSALISPLAPEHSCEKGATAWKCCCSRTLTKTGSKTQVICKLLYSANERPAAD